MKIRIIVLCVVFLNIGCGDDDASSVNIASPDDISIITGIELRQTPDDAALSFGNPNVKNNGVFVFSNPTIDFFSVSARNVGEIRNIWIVPGKVENIYQDVDFQAILKDVTYADQEIAQLSVQSLDGLRGSNEVTVNVKDLASGFYRVFVKTTETLHWNNILINNDGNTSIENIDAFWQ